MVAGQKPSGRPRTQGAKWPAPAEVVHRATRRQRLNVAGYGGGRRDVEVISAAAHRYEAGAGLVAVRWVWVHDGTGSHRDEYFFTTAVTQSVTWLIETYTGRRNIETTFDEMRAYLGLGTTRGRLPTTVSRVAPCLFGLYTVVAALYVPLPARRRRRRAIIWPGKQDMTFADAITAVRRWLWGDGVLAIPGDRTALTTLSRPFRQLLLAALAPAA